MTTEEECITALRRAVEELGESPSKAQYEELGYTPASATIQRVMGGWNAAKEQAGLETNTSTGSRAAEKPDDVYLPDGLEWEELSADQRWHYRNVDRNTRRTLHRRQQLRTWLADYKREKGGCSRCGGTDPACIDFHHVDPAEKEMAIHEMVLHGHSRSAIRSEIDKCIQLCANCHHREHDRRPEIVRRAATVRISEDPSLGLLDFVSTPATADDVQLLTKEERLRAWAFEYKRDHCCRDCREADPVCLQFHHSTPAEKSAGVGELISNGRPIAEVVSEVQKCEVLCANCHRKTHNESTE